MKNIEKELTVPKWVLIVWLKIPQCLKKLQPKMSAQAQMFKIFEKKTLWVSVVRDRNNVEIKGG